MIHILHWLLRLLLAGVFIWAGAIKLGDPAAFATNIENYRIVGQAASATLAVYLPWLELICGAALLLPWTWRGGTLVLGLLMVIFLVASGSAWMRGLDVNCGCLGGEEPISAWTLARNLLILAGLVGVALTVPAAPRPISTRIAAPPTAEPHAHGSEPTPE